ncbi:hypothetical protein ACLOJK_028953 [Asimina triloba]
MRKSATKYRPSAISLASNFGNTLLVDNGNINAWQGGELGSKHKRAAAAAAARQSCWFELVYINFQIPGAALKEKAIRHWNRKTYSHAAQMIASRQVDWIVNGKGRARAKEMRGMRHGDGELWRTLIDGKMGWDGVFSKF